MGKCRGTEHDPLKVEQQTLEVVIRLLATLEASNP